jgi:5-methylcytosine-specific restriction protein A
MPKLPRKLSDEQKPTSWVKKNEPPRIRGRRLQRERKMLFEDQPLCVECRKQGRVTVATQRDHIIPLSQGGLDVPENTQPLCQACHDEKSRRESRSGQEIKEGKVIVVYGPPGAGKTSYVMENMRAGDMIVDLDLIYSALSGQPIHHKPGNLLGFVLDVRETIYRMLDVRRNIADTIWIVISGAKREERNALIHRYNAATRLVRASVADCYERIKRDETRPGMARIATEIVDRWFREYEQ